MSEEQLQACCTQWFWNNYPQYRGLLHHNDNNSVNSIAGARKKALGVVPGVSDLELVWDYVYFIELKKPGGLQSVHQREFEMKITTLGHHYLIIYSFEEFKQFIWKVIGK